MVQWNRLPGMRIFERQDWMQAQDHAVPLQREGLRYSFQR